MDLLLAIQIIIEGQDLQWILKVKNEHISYAKIVTEYKKLELRHTRK